MYVSLILCQSLGCLSGCLFLHLSVSLCGRAVGWDGCLGGVMIGTGRAQRGSWVKMRLVLMGNVVSSGWGLRVGTATEVGAVRVCSMGCM